MRDEIDPKNEYLESNFPKICTSCNKSYEDEMSFFKSTSPLTKGSFSKGPKDTVLVYRNCSCGSTITLKLNDRRDYSEEGIKKREVFQEKMKSIMETMGVSKDQAVLLTKKELGLPH